MYRVHSHIPNVRRRVTPIVTIGAIFAVAGCSAGDASADESGDDPIELTLTTNAIVGGANDAEARWIEDYVVPTFEKQLAEDGRDVAVEFIPQGVDGESYKTRLALDLNSGEAPDVFALDSMLIGEFADAGYIEPLVGSAPESADWEGWNEIPEATQGSLSYDGDVYGIPSGAGGRVLFYNKELFQEAGLDTEWQPTSWEDVLEAGRTLDGLEDVTPIQLNAGTAMGEATTMQGFLPILAGAGKEIYTDGAWLGESPALKETLKLYRTIYHDEKLGDATLQQETNGRDLSFTDFSEGKIGVLAESDYFWRSVVNPDGGTAPMENRDETVGYAKIPAGEAGAGVDGANFISFDGAGGRLINPESEHKDLAWELLSFMNSKEAWLEYIGDAPRITPRADVNSEVLDDPMLSYIAEEVMPLNLYRPALSEYSEVSGALQQSTLDVVTDSSVEDAANTYLGNLENIVGADNVRG